MALLVLRINKGGDDAVEGLPFTPVVISGATGRGREGEVQETGIADGGLGVDCLDCPKDGLVVVVGGGLERLDDAIVDDGL